MRYLLLVLAGSIIGCLLMMIALAYAPESLGPLVCPSSATTELAWEDPAVWSAPSFVEPPILEDPYQNSTEESVMLAFVTLDDGTVVPMIAHFTLFLPLDIAGDTGSACDDALGGELWYEFPPTELSLEPEHEQTITF